MTTILTINSLDEITEVAREFLSLMDGKKLFAFYGTMGAGKTTFIKALCEVLGVTDNVTSPTFAIVNEYETERGDVIYHFDFYRLKNLQEVRDIGFDDYLDSGNVCLMEWPEMVEELLPDEVVKIRIEEQAGKREIICL